MGIGWYGTPMLQPSFLRWGSWNLASLISTPWSQASLAKRCVSSVRFLASFHFNWYLFVHAAKTYTDRDTDNDREKTQRQRQKQILKTHHWIVDSKKAAYDRFLPLVRTHPQTRRDLDFWSIRVVIDFCCFVASGCVHRRVCSSECIHVD